MSLDIIKSIFSSLCEIDNLSVHLINSRNNKVEGTQYSACRIEIADKELATLIMDISRLYTTGKKSIDKYYKEVTEYDGTAESTIVYRLSKGNPLISTEYERLITELANWEKEENPFKYNSAYLIKGEIPDNNNSEIRNRVILISCMNPITTLSGKYRFFNNSFHAIDEQVLNLRTTFDVLIFNDTIYFLTMASESFFQMEHAYKSVCKNTVETLIESELFSDPEAFKTIATSKHNPRRFVSYNKANFEYLKNKDNRIAISEIFNIKLTEDGRFDTSEEIVSDRIVRILCDKGMIHPIDKKPVEVNGKKPWL